MNNPKEGRIGVRRICKGAAIGVLLIGLRKTATQVLVAVFVFFWLAPQGHGWDSLFGLKSLNDEDDSPASAPTWKKLAKALFKSPSLIP